MDTREVGMRTGAAFNQAVQLTAASMNPFGTDVASIADLAAELALKAGELQDVLSGRVTPPVSQAPAVATAPQAPAPQPQQAVEQATQLVEQAFPGTTAVAAPEAGNLEVVGQEGPIPAWLLVETAKVGCTKVYDNRKDLAENPRRPWFKAADGTVNTSGRNAGKPMAFWPPKD